MGFALHVSSSHTIVCLLLVKVLRTHQLTHLPTHDHSLTHSLTHPPTHPLIPLFYHTANLYQDVEEDIATIPRQ